MFVECAGEQDDERRSVIGKFSRIEGDYIILETGTSEIRVEHRGLDSYQTKYVMVTGFVRDNILVEESTHRVEDSFNYDLYARLVSISSKFPEMF